MKGVFWGFRIGQAMSPILKPGHTDFNLVRRCSQTGPSWGQVAPSWRQVGPKLTPSGADVATWGPTRSAEAVSVWQICPFVSAAKLPRLGTFGAGGFLLVFCRLGHKIIIGMIPEPSFLGNSYSVLVSLHLSPCLAGGVRWCLALWMSVFNSPPWFVSQSGRWCPALRMSLFIGLPSFFSLCACGVRLSGCVFLLVSFCLPPRLAGGVGPFGCLSLILFVYLLFPIIWLPFWLVVSGSLDVSLHLFPFICLPCCLVVSGCPDVFCVFSLVSHRVPLAMCLPIFPSPN